MAENDSSAKTCSAMIKVLGQPAIDCFANEWIRGHSVKGLLVRPLCGDDMSAKQLRAELNALVGDFGGHVESDLLPSEVVAEVRRTIFWRIAGLPRDDEKEPSNLYLLEEFLSCGADSMKRLVTGMQHKPSLVLALKEEVVNFSAIYWLFDGKRPNTNGVSDSLKDFYAMKQLKAVVEQGSPPELEEYTQNSLRDKIEIHFTRGLRAILQPNENARVRAIFEISLGLDELINSGGLHPRARQLIQQAILSIQPRDTTDGLYRIAKTPAMQLPLALQMLVAIADQIQAREYVDFVEDLHRTLRENPELSSYVRVWRTPYINAEGVLFVGIELIDEKAFIQRGYLIEMIKKHLVAKIAGMKQMKAMIQGQLIQLSSNIALEIIWVDGNGSLQIATRNQTLM